MVPAVNGDVRARREGRRVRCEIEVSTSKLRWVALAAQWRLGLPQLVHLLRCEARDLRKHVAGRDRVGAREAGPFNGKRSACKEKVC